MILVIIVDQFKPKSNRQIKSKSKRIRNRANKTKEQQIKKQINNHILNNKKGLTKGERQQLVNDLYKDKTYNNLKELDNKLTYLERLNAIHLSLDNIISHVQKHVHNYQELVSQYQSTFLIDIKRYHYKLSNYEELFPLLNDYLNELQNSDYGQNYEKATSHTTPYTILGTLTDLIMETLEEVKYESDPEYVCERVKRRFEQTARDAFYASKQIRQEKLEEIYGLGQKMQIDKLHEMLGINV